MKVATVEKINVALVYDRVNKWGGAERVLLALHEIFPKAPLYTSVYDAKKAGWAKVFPKVYTSFLQSLPFAKSNHEVLAPLMPLAFNFLDLTSYDLVISVTSEAAKGVRVKTGAVHICYCLTPTRYLWSHHTHYFNNPFLKHTSKYVVKYLRSWDKIAAKRPDAIIAISTAVKARIKKYYGRQVDVIFPPVNVKRNGIRARAVGKYYLLVSRLVSYKKIDLAIEAFNTLGYPLVVVGEGREEKRLKPRAHKNIKFVGRVSEDRLLKYYKDAKALIMPQEEDFGIVALEAQSFGVPVIALKKGGAIDTVSHGVTGVLFDVQSVDALIAAIKSFEKIKFSPKKLVANAQKFSKNVFQKKFLDLTRKMLH